MSIISPPTPLWSELPKYAQTDLTAKGFQSSWFEKQGLPEGVRLSILNLYVKLRGIRICGMPGWFFIKKVQSCEVGYFMFWARSVEDFKESLTFENTFASPGSADSWDSRELCPYASVHFKHDAKDFAKLSNGENIVSVHIDPRGLATAPGVWGKVSPLQGLDHLCNYYGYEDAQRIRDILLNAGWDNAPLVKAA